MLGISTLCFTVAVIAGTWLGINILQGRRPLRVMKPIHVGAALIGSIFMVIALAQGQRELILNVALAIAVIAFGVLMSWARKQGYLVAPLYVCHTLLAVLFYLSLVSVTLFPNF
ncbi:hypothetical protein QMA67_04720 [Gluconobacter japonicus]|uniref:hypothetical protein n=1 Tax=Gluconobacter japonicus TaxID=376620 RepID=UPI0024ACCE9D|nr:hypothetical protein [Gluconobacter japonicus]MDI6652250.1 hypothetical protein [Gluconobacter japonicus]